MLHKGRLIDCEPNFQMSYANIIDCMRSLLSMKVWYKNYIMIVSWTYFGLLRIHVGLPRLRYRNVPRAMWDRIDLLRDGAPERDCAHGNVGRSDGMAIDKLVCRNMGVHL